MAEHLDHLHYLNDILCLRIDNLNEVLTDHLLNRLFIPLYIYSLVRNPVASNSIEVNPTLYGVRNLEKTIRFSQKSWPSERFHWSELSQIKAEISLSTNVKLIFHKNVGW